MADNASVCPKCQATLPSGAGRPAFCPACGAALAAPAARLDLDHGAAFGMEDGGDLGVSRQFKEALREFKALDYANLLPFDKILSSSLLRMKAVRWVLLFGLMPLVFFQLHAWFEFTFEQTIWLIELYFCLFWALYFYSIIRPSKDIWRRAVCYGGFTAFIGIPLLLGAQSLPVVRDLYHRTESYGFVPRLIGYVFGVGVFEECCKALPLVIFGLRGNKIATVREGVFLGMLSGFGFAAAEGVRYTVSATVMAHHYGAVSEQFMQFIFRIMSGPILHGSWAGTVGWFVGIAATQSGKKWPIVTVGIAAMAALHGLYDVFAGNVIGLALAALTFITFMAYLGHGEQLAATTSSAPPAPRT